MLSAYLLVMISVLSYQLLIAPVGLSVYQLSYPALGADDSCHGPAEPGAEPSHNEQFAL